MATEPGWLDAFPGLAELGGDALRLLRTAAVPQTIPAGTVLFRSGSPCRHYFMILDGTVRVGMVGANGREIVLYRVGRGETCILTTACLMARRDYGAEGMAETAVGALALPRGPFEELIAQSAGFRDFVFTSYGARLTDLILLVEEVAFRRIDVRLAGLLIQRAAGAGGLAITHQEIAVELGTAREVVSRQLKEFERRGWVALSRGRVTVVDGPALRALGQDRP